MLTEERVLVRPPAPPRLEEKRGTPVRQEPRPEFSVLGLLGRLLLLAVGFGLVFTGWMLVMSVSWCSSASLCSSWAGSDAGSVAVIDRCRDMRTPVLAASMSGGGRLFPVFAVISILALIAGSVSYV